MNFKITLIVLILAIIIPLIIYNGAIGDFAPVHMAVMHEVTTFGHNSEASSVDVPGFYDFSAISAILLDLPARTFLFLPLQLIPYAIILFCLIYKISNNYFLASIVTLIEMLSDVTGSVRVFLWPHGLGYILFYTILLILLNDKINEDKFKKFKIPITVVGISLVYVSYDLHILSEVYLLVTSVLFLIFLLINFKKFNFFNIDKVKERGIYTTISKTLLFIFIIIAVAQFGLSNFFYVTIVPTYHSLNSMELSGIDKLFLSYSSYDIKTPIKDLYLTYPQIISMLSAVKYVLLFVSLLIFSLIILKKIRYRTDIKLNDIFIASLVLTFCVYALLRLAIGGMIINLFYFPGMISTVWLFKTGKFRKWSIFVISIILIIVPTYYFLNYHYDLINKDENKFVEDKPPAYWFYEHRPNNIFSIAISDELTKGLSSLYISEKYINDNDNIHYNDIQQKLGVFSIKNIMYLTKKSNDPDVGRYFIINYGLNYLSIYDWILIKPWKFSRDKLDDNRNLNKVYDIESIAIYGRI